MKNKFFMFVFSVVLSVSILIAGSVEKNINKEESQEETPFSYMADDPGEDVVVTVYDAKPEELECVGYIYVFYENGEEKYTTLDKLEDIEGYTYINSVIGTKINCNYCEDSLCRQFACGYTVHGK